MLFQNLVIEEPCVPPLIQWRQSNKIKCAMKHILWQVRARYSISYKTVSRHGSYTMRPKNVFLSKETYEGKRADHDLINQPILGEKHNRNCLKQGLSNCFPASNNHCPHLSDLYPFGCHWTLGGKQRCFINSVLFRLMFSAQLPKGRG